MEKQRVIDILNSEMKLATGCTEPAAIALTAAYAAVHLGGERAERIEVAASGNMIKNAMAAGIPGSSFTGIEYAAAIGAVAGDPEKELRVIEGASQDDWRAAQALVAEKKVSVRVADTDEKLYIDVSVFGPSARARAVISGAHTNVALIEENGAAVYRAEQTGENRGVTQEEIRSLLSVSGIFDFVNGLDPEHDPLDIIRQSISVNTAISEEGLKNDYGLRIGKLLRAERGEGILGDGLMAEAMSVTTAGADARMAGAPFAVVSNSGSGNQGITATMPVVAVAKQIDAGEDRTIRAVTLSNLIVIYIKSKFGRLSALCGATVAGTGAACGITYLLGGDRRAVEFAIQNMIGNVTGMLCDGAKADCALKICTCTGAAVQAALMALRGVRVQKTDGIVEEDVEKSIDNFAALGNRGSSAMDPLVLDMMLHKSGS